eukprot:211489-Pleurochrysis_carterae.AAC.2
MHGARVKCANRSQTGSSGTLAARPWAWAGMEKNGLCFCPFQSMSSAKQDLVGGAGLWVGRCARRGGVGSRAANRLVALLYATAEWRPISRNEDAADCVPNMGQRATAQVVVLKLWRERAFRDLISISSASRMSTGSAPP